MMVSFMVVMKEHKVGAFRDWFISWSRYDIADIEMGLYTTVVNVAFGCLMMTKQQERLAPPWGEIRLSSKYIFLL